MAIGIANGIGFGKKFSFQRYCTPQSITITYVSGGVRISWTSSCSNETGFQIWVSDNGGAYTLLTTTAADATYYDDLSAYVAGHIISYKVRAIKDFTYSDFSDVETWTSIDPPLTNMKLWYKANAGVTQAGGLVSAWNDYSGNNNHALQASGTEQPAYTASEINGIPGIAGVSSDFLQYTNLGVIGSFNIFLVLKVSLNNEVILGDAGGTYYIQMLANTQIRMNITITKTWNTGTLTGWHIFEITRDIGAPSPIRCYIDGVESATTGLTSATNVNNLIYLFRTTTVYGRDSLAELIIYTALKNDADRLAITNYLKYKYFNIVP